MQLSGIREGLYDPFFEHDACGVGFVCHVRNEPSHDIVRKGIEMLINLRHRGACGCDPRTGDGTGILLQMPHEFFAPMLEDFGVGKHDPGTYAAGLVFLPREADQQAFCKDLFGDVVRAEGQALLGWRPVPRRADAVGEVARTMEPDVVQVFIGRGKQTRDWEAFERKLYVIRKRAERAIRESVHPGAKDAFYVVSLSSRTIIYKGMLLAEELARYYPDLSDPLMKSALAMIHSRFSTNTLPEWRLAQPFRFLCHNGEINTLRGNVNWMNTRQALFESELFGDDMRKLLPILDSNVSDSAILDNAAELLYFTGRSLPHAMMMLVPEAWEYAREMSQERRAFYEYHSCLMEPWDGPATLPFTDGRYIGSVLDRNGLRPSRFTVTKDGLVILASETGVLPVDPADVVHKGRLQPGKMFLVDLEEHRVIDDDEIKEMLATRRPYVQWIRDQAVHIQDLPDYGKAPGYDREELHVREQIFGYTLEDERILMKPMGILGKEALGSMGDDTPLAVLSDRPRLLYDYFRQLFAQVTNPPLDAIREEMVTSLFTRLGAERDLFQETPQHCRKLFLKQPILSDRDLTRILHSGIEELGACKIDIVFGVGDAGEGGREALHGGKALDGGMLRGGLHGGRTLDGGMLREALDRICAEAAQRVEEGRSVLILSDRTAGPDRLPIPALLATAAVHHHLIRRGLRTRASIVVESGEPREVHHFCTLIGYGADAVNPYLALQVIVRLLEQEDLSSTDARVRYIESIGTGVLKVMSKMGISTVQSYRGAQIFEAVGIAQDVIDVYFTGTSSRIGGIGLDVIAEETRMRHARAWPSVRLPFSKGLDPGGRYLWRRHGEYHLFNPMTVARLQHAVRTSEAGRVRGICPARQ